MPRSARKAENKREHPPLELRLDLSSQVGRTRKFLQKRFRVSPRVRVGLIFAVCFAIAGSLAIKIATSPAQLARQFLTQWSIGTLEFDPSVATRVGGERSIRLSNVALLEAGPLSSFRVDALSWRPATATSWLFGNRWDGDTVTFDHARADLSWEASVPDLSWENLPSEIRGSAIRLRMHLGPTTTDSNTAPIEIRLDDPRFTRNGQNLRFETQVADPNNGWRNGQWRWIANGDLDQWQSRLRLDDLACGRFSFSKWEPTWGFEWPVFLRAAKGTVDLDWTAERKKGEIQHALRVQHYQLSVPLAGSQAPLSSAAGLLHVNDERSTWKIETAYLGETRVSGELSWRDPLPFSGQFKLHGPLADPAVRALLPSVWSRLVGALPLLGEADTHLTVSGTGQTAVNSWIETVEFSVPLSIGGWWDGVVRGRGSLSADGDGWIWQGELVPPAGTPLTWNVQAADGGASFQLGNAEQTLAKGQVTLLDERLEITADTPWQPIAMIDPTLVDGRWRIEEWSARWEETTGWSWEAKVAWSDVVVPGDWDWPGSKPSGSVEGFFVATQSGSSSRKRIALLGAVLGTQSRWDIAGEFSPKRGYEISGQRYSSPIGEYHPFGSRWSLVIGTPFRVRNRGVGLRWDRIR